MNFVMSFLISANWKGNSYDSISVIIDQLTKMIYYKPVKVTINVPSLAEVIIDIVVCHYRFFESIITNQSLLFTLKFWSLLCYFLEIQKSYL